MNVQTLGLVLLALGTALSALASPAKLRVGVINWDCSAPTESWFGGYQTRSLSPARYRHLTPYYADVLAPEKISYHRRTPEEYDRELRYAIDAGIDYFAYCWYGEDSTVTNRVPICTGEAGSCENHLWEITWARRLHMRSALRAQLKLCAIVLGAHVYTDGEVANLARAMKEDCYERLADGQPLLYIFGDASKGEILARIRRACRAVGAREPYVVAMHGRRKDLPATGDSAVAARSSYAPPAPPKDGAFLRYPEMFQAILRMNASWIAEGFEIVPAFATGRDHWPRIEHQVPWGHNPVYRYASPATERELVECAQAFKRWIDANRAHCPLGHVITYAWNEFEEGAWICPTWGPNGQPDTSRLAAFRKVARIFKGEEDVTACPDDPLPSLADVRKRIPEVFRGCEDSFQCERAWKRLAQAERLATLPERTLLMQAELDEFRAYFRDAFAHWESDPANPAVKTVELNVRDFGAAGDGRTDDAPAFRRAAAAVRALNGRPSVLRLGAGTYRLATPSGVFDGMPINADFGCLTNCLVTGESPEKTRLVFAVYDAHGISYSRSLNTTVANVECRWEQPPFAETRVESYDPKTFSAVVTVHPRGLRPDDPRYRKADHAQVCCVFDKTGCKVSRGATPFFDFRAEDLGGGRFRIFFDAKRNGMANFRPLPGDVIVLPDRSNKCAGTHAYAATFCNFAHVWFRNARSSAINAGATHYTTAVHCRTFPAEGFVFSSNADTFYNARGSYLAHCDFHHMCDDGANSLGYGTPVLSVDGPRALTIRVLSGRLRVGDVVQVMDAMAGRFRADLRVAAVTRFVEKGERRLRLVFDADLPAGIRSVAAVGAMDAQTRYAISHGLGNVPQAADLLYAPLQFGTGFTVFDNRIHDLRGCGINVQCPHSLVESNIVERVSVGLKMTGLTEWFEGTPPYDVVIRNNVFRELDNGIISHFNTVNAKRSAEKPIRWLEVTGNRIENVKRPLGLANCRDEVVRDNVVRGTGK